MKGEEEERKEKYQTGDIKRDTRTKVAQFQTPKQTRRREKKREKRREERKGKHMNNKGQTGKRRHATTDTGFHQYLDLFPLKSLPTIALFQCKVYFFAFCTCSWFIRNHHHFKAAFRRDGNNQKMTMIQLRSIWHIFAVT